MAYDDIRISELPSIPELHANDLILIQDVTNNLAHRIDWGRLKNSIGTLSKGITFPLGTTERPELAIGDHTSGIMAEDYGTFVIVTHGYKRFKINQAGTIELLNGNVVIGNYDRQCTYSLVVNNITRFNCYTSFGTGVDVDGNLDVSGNITGGKSLNVPGNVILGTDCTNSLIINGQIRAMCDMDLKGTMAIHEDLSVDGSLRVNHDVSLGSSCSDKLDVYSNAWFRCDLKVDGDLSFGGDLVLDGDVNIGSGCSNQINLNGTTTVLCDFRVKGETYLEQDLFAFGNANVTGNLIVSSDVQLGANCDNTTYINSSLIAECTSFFRDSVTIGDPGFICPGTPLQVNGNLGVKCDILGDKNLVIDHNTTLGTNCDDDLLVKATPVFECDAEFQKSVNITDELFVGGDFTTNGHLIEIADPTIGCTNPNLINIHGEVHIDCNLFVSGDVFYDGDLQITGPDITFGAGCDLSTIHLQGHTIAHCDMVVEGHTAPFALTVKKNLQVYENTDLLGVLNVAKDSAHDARLFVHEDTLLNMPVPALNYWEQCECIDGLMWGNSLTPPQGNQTNRAGSFTTYIHGTQKSLCQVYLNDPRWYKANNADPHVQMTEVYGSLFARANVDLNSNAAKSADGNHQQKTSIWGQLQQYSVVELNKYIDTGKGHGYNNGEHATNRIEFNTLTNKNQTVVHGDANFRKSVILNDGENRLTVVQGRFEAREEARLEKNVHLSGGNSGNSRQCGTYSTHIWGDLVQHCTTTLGETCADHITMNGSTSIMNGVELSNGYGQAVVTAGQDGFFISGGGKCARNSYHYAVTTVKGSEPIVADKSPINIYIAGPRDVTSGKMTGDLVITAEAGNGEYKVTSAGNGITVSNGSVRVNQTVSTSQQLGFSCGDASLGTLVGSNGISGSYDPCGGKNQSIKFDCGSAGLKTHTIQGGTGIKVKSGPTYTPCGDTTTVLEFDPSVLPDPCDKMKPLKITVSGEGSGGGTYNPCTGADIDIKINKQAGDGTGGGDCDGTVVIKQGGATKGEFNICGSDTTIELDAGGTGSPGAGKLVLKAGDGITIDKGTNTNFNANQQTGKDCTWTFNVDPASCPDYTEAISAQRIRVKASGGAKNPGIALGTSQAYNGNGPYAGIFSNQANGSISVIRGSKWKNIDNCGGSSDGEPDKLFSVAAGLTVNPHHGTVGLIKNGGAKNLSVDCFKYADSELDSGINGGAPEFRQYNRFCFNQTSFGRGEIPEVNRATDSRVDINIDSVIDRLGGFADDPETPNGMFIWGLKPLAEDDNTTYPFLFMDANEVGSIFPNLVDWTPKNTAWQRVDVYAEDGTVDYTEHELKDSFDPATDLVPGKINQNALIGLILAGVNRQRKRLDNLKVVDDNGTTTLNNPVKFEEIIKIDLPSLVDAADDTCACDLGVEVGQVYRNGSQLMVRIT
jgi:hypothetical protein